jgi:hydrogenase expression/formation protein HypC
VTQIYEADGVRMAKLDFGGVMKNVCLEYLPEIVEGEYAIVHVGFAISRIDEDAAQETLRMLREIGAIDEELNATETPTCALDPFSQVVR